MKLTDERREEMAKMLRTCDKESILKPIVEASPDPNIRKAYRAAARGGTITAVSLNTDEFWSLIIMASVSKGPGDVTMRAVALPAEKVSGEEAVEFFDQLADALAGGLGILAKFLEEEPPDPQLN